MSAELPQHPRSASNSRWIIGAAVGVAGVALIVVWLLMTSRTKETPAPPAAPPPPVAVAPTPEPAEPAPPKPPPNPRVNEYDPEGRTALHTAAELGEPVEIKMLIDQGADLNLMTRGRSPGHTALAIAILRGKTDNAQVLIDRGADVNMAGSSSEYSHSPLWFAVNQNPGNIRLVRVLLDKGAKPDFSGGLNSERPPLVSAVSNGRIDIAQLLIDRGADVHKGGPLHAAAFWGRVDVAKFLLSKGVKVDERSCWSNTALYNACYRSNVPMVNFLIEQGADVNAKDTSDGGTVLHHCIYQTTAEVVGILLSRGADPNARDKEGKSALERAIERDRPDLATLFLAKSPASSYPLLLTVAARGQDPKPVEMLLAKGVPVDACDAEGRTALHAAADRSRTRVMAVLLKKGANVEARDKEGKTPLMEAAEDGASGAETQVEAIRILLAAGAKVNAACAKEAPDHAGWTALHFAAAAGSLEAAKALVEKGADVNLKTAKGETALVLAEDERDVREFLEPLTKKPPEKPRPKRLVYIVSEGKVRYLEGSPEDRKGREFKVVETSVGGGDVKYVEEEVVKEKDGEVEGE